MLFIVATNVIASWKPERRPTGMLTTCANYYWLRYGSIPRMPQLEWAYCAQLFLSISVQNKAVITNWMIFDVFSVCTLKDTDYIFW